MKLVVILAFFLGLTACVKKESPVQENKPEVEKVEVKAITDKTIRFATVNWPPYYSENLKNGGPYTEITRAAFEKVGYKYIIDFMPWKRALVLGEAGTKYHGLQGAYFNKERNQVFHYSNIVYPAAIHFISKKEKKLILESIESLSKYKVGIIRGYTYSPEFDSNKSIKKIIVNNPEQFLNMLLKDRIDIAMDEKLVLLSEIEKNMPDKKDEFTIHEPPMHKQPLFNIISKKIPNAKQVINDFNEGLKMIQEDGTLKKIFKSHGF